LQQLCDFLGWVKRCSPTPVSVSAILNVLARKQSMASPPPPHHPKVISCRIDGHIFNY
jgi:hypothetical protein